MNIDQVLEMMYEVRTEDSYAQVGYNLRPSDNEYGVIVKKVIKIGAKKLITLKTDMEEIAAYANEFIFEALLTYDGSYEDLEALESHIALFAYDCFNKLSKDNSVNSDYYWNKATKKFENVKTCELKEDLVYIEQRIENPDDDDNEAKDFVEMYFNTDYLTPEQVKFIEAIDNYGIRSDGSVKDIDDNTLYRQPNTWKMKKRISERLEKYFDK